MSNVTRSIEELSLRYQCFCERNRLDPATPYMLPPR